MPLSPKLHLQPTRTENMLAYSIPSSYRDYHRSSFFPRTVTEWNILKPVPVPGTPLQYILQCSVESSAPYREEPEDVNSLLSSISAQVVMHLSPALVHWTNCHFRLYHHHLYRSLHLVEVGAVSVKKKKKDYWTGLRIAQAPTRNIPFINAVKPFYECQRSARKNITVTLSVKVSVTVRVSLVWLHSGNNLVALCIAIWWMK